MFKKTIWKDFLAMLYSFPIRISAQADEEAAEAT